MNQTRNGKFWLVAKRLFLICLFSSLLPHTNSSLSKRLEGQVGLHVRRLLQFYHPLVTNLFLTTSLMALQ